jgi:hypothetical protein
MRESSKDTIGGTKSTEVEEVKDVKEIKEIRGRPESETGPPSERGVRGSSLPVLN